MRIVSGKYGGRIIEAPKGRDTRPTSDKVRGAIFNALRARGAVEGAVVLDGFAGTGALGLEALSQGAGSCAFIEKNPKAMSLIKANAESLGLGDEARFMVKDLTKIGVRPEDLAPADLVFLDPPYNRDLVPSALTFLQEGGWIAPDAFCVLEVEKDFAGALPAFLSILDEKIYGDTKVIYLRYESPPK